MSKYSGLSFLLMSSFAFGGGSSGGTGTLEMMDSADLLRVMQPNLGLETLEIPVDDFRRARLRLSSSSNEMTPISINGDQVMVKQKLGGLTNLDESRQLLPKKH